MKKNPIKDKEVDTGTLVLGDIDRSTESFPVRKFLFRCKKDGFAYLGQAGIDAREPSFQIEMFNGNYFARFESPREEVHSALENKILVQLSRMENIPADYVSVIRSLLEQKNPAENAPALPCPPEESLLLQRLLGSLNHEYFDGKIDAQIQWGRNTLSQNRRSVRFGSYDFKNKLIRINPRLGQDFVPLQVLELTIYHEMCHQFVPPFKQSGKRLAHHAEFKKKEREYKFYSIVKQWERQHWKKLMAPHSSQISQPETMKLT